MNIEKWSPEEIERYKIEHPAEIERILRAVMEKKALVTAYSENNRDFLVTTLIAVDPVTNAIYLGCGPDARLDESLVASKAVSFNTAHDQIRVLFTTPGLKRVTLHGEPALRAAMPAELLRFQRREFYRLPTSMLNPARCLIPMEGGTLETVVADISIGGIGVLAYDQDADLVEGRVYRGCRLSLPDAGAYVVSLRVRTVYQQTLKNRTQSRRVGCQFIDLSPSVETDIQRYIIRVERERRASVL